MLLSSACQKAEPPAEEPETVSQEQEIMNKHFYDTPYEGKWYQKKDNLELFLFMGVDEAGAQVDSESYNNLNQADFLLLAVLDREAKSYTLLHINRDTMADIPVLSVTGDPMGTIYGQLALAHTYGSGLKDSCRNTVDAVSAYLYNTPINHYGALSMAGIPILNDAVGGVTVTIEDDFSKVDPSMEMGKELTLSGKQAEYYVRYRKDVADNSNLNRMKRQRDYINAWIQEAENLYSADESMLLKTLLALSDYLVSDLTANQMSKLAQDLQDYDYQGIVTIEGEAKKGEEFMEFYTDEEQLQSVIIQLFYEEVPD